MALTHVLTGCGLWNRTPYQRPQVAIPTHWAQTPGNLAAGLDPWWLECRDQVLSQMIAEALVRNTDLATAAIKVRKARLQAELAGSDRLPSLQVTGNASHSHNLRGQSSENNLFSATTASSLAADLGGNLASAEAAARWQAMATEEDRLNVALALSGSVAKYRWQIGYLNQRIELSLASTDYARRTLELVQVQKAAGAATALDLLEAERNLASQEASHSTLLQQRVEVRNSLAILFDQPPETITFSELTNLSRQLLPEVAVGLPAELLARRPDMRAAEARLRASLADTDATRASFYPTLTLDGRMGLSSTQLSSLVQNPLGSLAADLALPFVQWRDMRRRIDISEADFEATTLSFRRALYTAFTEVENGLAARANLLVQGEQLEIALRAAQKSEALYQVRYREGGSALKNWLDAQENRRQAEIAVAENRLKQLENHIALVIALGGGLGEGAKP